MPIRIPHHVVFRHFVNETVVLNLQTGKYHGLNRTAGRMLHELITEGSLATRRVELATSLVPRASTARLDRPFPSPRPVQEPAP